MNFSIPKKIVFLFLAAFIYLVGIANAKIPEPDNIIYGTITIGNTLITANDTGVSVTLKIDDTPIVTYTMGSNTNAQNYYVLTVPIDIYGDQQGSTARPGDTATIFVGQAEAGTIEIGDRGSISQRHLTIGSIQCTSQNGELLSSSTYVEGVPCGQPYHDLSITSGFTVSWDGSGGPVTGKVTVGNNATLKITGPGGTLNNVLLDNGIFDINYNTTISHFQIQNNSDLFIAQNKILTVSDDLTIPAGNTLTMGETGTLKITGSFNLDGVFEPGIGVVDLIGTTLVLGSNLNLSGSTIITDESTKILLTDNVILTSDQAITVAELRLNNHSLTLGSATSDLTIMNPLTLDHANEKVITGDADLILMSNLTLSNGTISSTGGNINLNGGGEITGGTIDISGSFLNTNGGFNKSGGTIVTDSNSQSTPFANAGNNQTANISVSVTLNGTDSSDVDGSIVSYSWQQLSGSGVALTGASSSQSYFTTPSIAGSSEELIFKLTVTDDQGLTDTSNVSVFVIADGTYLVSVNKSGSGIGSIIIQPTGFTYDSTCDSISQAFGSGSIVQLSAQAEAGSVFVGWNLATCKRHEICEINLTDNIDITATFIIPSILNQVDINSGFISEMYSPYRVASELFLTLGKTLIIEPGVSIYFDPNTHLNIAGQIEIQGTSEKNVVLTASDATKKWGGLLFSSNHQSYSTIYFSSFSYAISPVHLECCGETTKKLTISDSKFQNNDNAISGFASYEVDIKKSTFSDNNYGLFGTRRVNVYSSTFLNNEVGILGESGIAKYNTINQNTLGVQNTLEGMKLSQNTIQNNQVGIEIVDPTYGTVTPTVTINQNNILENITYNLNNSQATNFNFSENWWGSTVISTIMSDIYDKEENPALGTISVSPMLSALVDITPPSMTGVRGDIDNDNQLTGGDVTRIGQCITHSQFVNDFGATQEQANTALGIDYQIDCTRVNDIDGDYQQTGGDTTRLGQCITHIQIVNDFGATEAQANTALGITFAIDCVTATSDY